MSMANEHDQTDKEQETVVIKKYANRRLYNTKKSCYVTLDHLAQMVQEGADFVVYDAKTGDDITRSVLTQIIVDAESKGENLLPISFLRQLITFYGHSLQGLVPRYLDYSMRMFQSNQDRFRDYVHGTLDGLFPMSNLEEVGRQNMALFDRAMQMFRPFGQAGGQDDDTGQGDAGTTGDKAETGEKAGDKPSDHTADLDALRAQLDAVQVQLNELTKDRKDKK